MRKLIMLLLRSSWDLGRDMGRDLCRGLALVLTLAGCASSNVDTRASMDVPERGRYLAADLAPSELRDALMSCDVTGFAPSDFSISHRGAPLGYPEHTLEGYQAAIEMGAGVIECDVTFTADKQLVCRHSQCDLHSTTNILTTPLASQCSTPFQAANEDTPASARCCTSDITLAQFRTLCGRRDIVNPRASTIEEYLNPPDDPRVAPWLNESVTCGTLMTHAESIKLIGGAGRKFTPELKSPMVPMPYQGMSQTDYADKLINEYKDAGIASDRVFPQSFNINDVLYWVSSHPEFAAQSVFLDPRGRDPQFKPSLSDMQALFAKGVRILAPPIPMLLRLNEDGQPVPSDYAIHAKAAGLELITWTFESGDASAPNNWLYTGLHDFLTHEAKALEILHILATEVGVRGIFSDWPGTVSYYRACTSNPS